jgi:ribosomal protein L12E/L44/L45/RPP1/RPP2
MRKFVIASGLALSLAACAGAPAIVASVFDLVNAYTLKNCGYTFASATIDAVIKAFGGKPLEDVIGSFLCTEARALAAARGPKAATASP